MSDSLASAAPVLENVIANIINAAKTANMFFNLTIRTPLFELDLRKSYHGGLLITS